MQLANAFMGTGSLSIAIAARWALKTEPKQLNIEITNRAN